MSNNNIHPAIKELYKLIQKKDWSEFYPEKTRQQILEMWIEKWIVPVEFSQSVIDTKYLTSEFDDIIKTKLGQGITDELMNDCITYNTKDREITGTCVALRREKK